MMHMDDKSTENAYGRFGRRSELQNGGRGKTKYPEMF